MAGQLARAGEFACTNDNCGMIGLRQAETGRLCADCGDPLERVAAPKPIPAPGSIYARVADIKVRKPRALRAVVAIAVGVVAIIVLFLVRNPDFMHRFTGHEYKVGDCVHVQPRIVDETMVRTDCAPPRSIGNLNDAVYQVVDVRDGKDASCGGINGFAGITFSNEPENTTYCLRMYFGP